MAEERSVIAFRDLGWPWEHGMPEMAIHEHPWSMHALISSTTTLPASQ